jgi:hypothetical protein
MASLGYQAHAMTMPGIPLHVIGRDATILRGGADSTGADTSYTTDTLVVSPGEAYDAIFEAPPHSGGSGPDVYQFFDRNYADNSNGSSSGLGGMRTEVHVYPATGPDALREQRDPVDAPNDQGL